jgi:multicomponent K+:H+ antiporter subunit E
MRRFVPHPFLAILLGAVWILLAGDLALGTIVMAVILALGIRWIIPRPAAPRIAQPLALIAYGGLVVWDVIVASVQVARIIVFMPKDQIKSAFIAVPIDLPSPQAITILAGTITLTPGTLTADISSDGSVLLIHALHAPDPVATRDDIKSRYEARLKRIFA